MLAHQRPYTSPNAGSATHSSTSRNGSSAVARTVTGSPGAGCSSHCTTASGRLVRPESSLVRIRRYQPLCQLPPSTTARWAFPEHVNRERSRHSHSRHVTESGGASASSDP